MLIGQYQHNLDAKGRLIMPQKFREELGVKFILTRGVDNCLFVYSLEEWEVLAEKIRALPLSKGRDLQRFFFANAQETECDSMGRTLIPQNLREHGRLSKEVVIIGSGQRVEIWDKSAWDGECDALTGDRIIEAMEEIGF